MSHHSATGNDQNAPLSDAAKAIARRLRPSDSIYRLSNRVFGIVLPETDTLNSKRIAVRFQDELQGVQWHYGCTFDLPFTTIPIM